MERVSLALARMIRRRPQLVAAVALAAAVAMAFGIPRLEFRTGQDTLLNPGSTIARDNTRFQREFGGDPMLVLFSTADDGPPITQLFTRDNRDEMARLERDMAASGRYESIITPLLILDFAREQIERRMVEEPAKLARDMDAADAQARAGAAARGEPPAQQDSAAADARQRVLDAFDAEFGADADRFLAVGDRTFDNPLFVEFILYDADGNIRPDLAGVFPDDHHALMVVRLRGNLSIDEGSRLAAEIVDQVPQYRFDRVSALVSGPPLLIKEINDSMRSALVLMALLAVALMVAVLFVVFRARWRLLSLPAVLIGCISAFGLMGFAGIPLTMVTISGLPILIGLGVDFAIQIHSRIEEETFAANSAEHGLDRTFVQLGPALGVAAVAACIGFLVLHLSEVPMIRDFGSMLAVGSVIVFMTSVALISTVVFLRERTRIGEPRPATVRFEVERIVGGITGRAVGRLVPIALIAIAVALVGLYVGRRIPTQTDPEKFVPSDSKVLRDLHTVRDVAGSTSELNLLIETGDGRSVTDDDILAWMINFEMRQRDQHDELRQSNSVASFTRQVTGDPPARASAEDLLARAPQALVNSVVSEDRRMASITFAISGGDTLDEQKALTNAILADVHAPPGVRVAPAGIAVVGTETVDAISRNRDLMSFVAVVSIFVVLLVFFRNPAKAVAPLLPVVLALGASSMILYLSGVEYSPLTSISGPLIIAMGTEFNVLLMSRYFEERGRGTAPRQAMAEASLRIGRAITASGLTVMGGFAVLALSDFSLLDNFGKVTALNIGLSLFSTLILLPPLLVWADEDHHLIAVPIEAAGEQSVP
ncbi:MAG: MMPL family transporter [Dehalococcoidia bacterium]